MAKIAATFVLFLSQVAPCFHALKNEQNVFNGDDIMKNLHTVLRSPDDISAECSASLTKLISGVKNFEYWAIKMLDATGKPGGGQLRGSMSALGSYEECLDIAPEEDIYQPALKGKYCLLFISPASPTTSSSSNETSMDSNFVQVLQRMIEDADLAYGYSMGFRLGVCLPSLCSQQDIRVLAANFSDGLDLSTAVVSCEVRESLHVDAAQWAVLSITGAFILAVVVCSCVHYCCNSQMTDGLRRRLIASFSVSSNIQRLLRSTTENDKDSSLRCLHGLRFFSMTWVVLLHVAIIPRMDIRVFSESAVLEDQNKDFLFQSILNGSFSVDTFFFITSVILSYNALKRQEIRNISTTLVSFVKRILRLLPSAMLVVGLVIILPLLGSGPMWKLTTEMEASNCRKNWWATPLFMKNLLVLPDRCIMHSWYISADMQFFLVGLLFLFAYTRHPKTSMAALISLAGISVVTVTSVCWYMELFPTFLPGLKNVELQMTKIKYTYLLPYCHLAVYAIGLTLGTFLAKRTDINFSKGILVLGWSLAILCNVSVVYLVLIWNNGSQNPVGIFPAFYSGLHRPLWALGLAWITLVCARGHGGIINEFLSWRGFGFMYKVSYMVYLIHIPIIWYQQAGLTQLIEPGHPTLVWNFFGTLTISMGVALILHIVFEAPVDNLVSMMFKGRNVKTCLTVMEMKNIEIVNGEEKKN